MRTERVLRRSLEEISAAHWWMREGAHTTSVARLLTRSEHQPARPERERRKLVEVLEQLTDAAGGMVLCLTIAAVGEAGGVLENE